jgi:hypothetical protein
MKRLVLILALLIALLATGISTGLAQTDAAQGISGETRAIVNLRSGPGSAFAPVAVLPSRLQVTFTGRNQSSTWLYTLANNMEGWLSYTFVNVNGDVGDLPIVGGAVAPAAPAAPNAPPPPQDAAGPVPASAESFRQLGIVPVVTANVRNIYLRGQQLGNNADVFSKVGDSITSTRLFLNSIGLGGLQLYDYQYLRPVVDYFSQTPLRDHFSFANSSVAARGGWRSGDVLDPSKNVPGICQPGESPLACEYRINRPAIALIMFGTNDMGSVQASVYRANMERIVQISLEQGVIPVLSTIPDMPGTYLESRVFEFNQIIADITVQYDIPLWNFWLALQDLPNRGLGGDNVHPSYDYTTNETAIFSPDGLRYGFNMRNLTALMVLDAIWREAMY